MKNRSSILFVPIIGLLFVSAAAQSVSNPADRQKCLALGESLLAPRPTVLPAGYKDPFYSAPFVEALTGVVQMPGNNADASKAKRSGKDILIALATSIHPSGFFVLGGEPTLIIGQKRVKAGTPMTIPFEGTEYTVEITAVDRTNFTLRLNGEEYTRPIK